MGKKKQFINKKTSHTFQLMARDSTDPEFTQSDRIFVRVDNNPLPADSVFADSPDDPDAEFGNYADDEFDAGGSGTLSDEMRKEILELGFPDDGYNYLNHLREIKNAGGGSYYYTNPKFKLQHVPSDVKAYDASRVRITEANEEPGENTFYSVASNTANVRVQKAVDPEVAALLDFDSDVSHFGSDVEDLEEDFVVQANLHGDNHYEEEPHVINGMNIAEESLVDRSLNNEHALQVSAYSTVADDFGPLDGGANGVTGVRFVGEEQRPRRLLDEQFDLLESQEYGTDDNSDDDYDGNYEENDRAEDESLAKKLNLSLSNHEMDNLKLDEDSKYTVPADLLKKKDSCESEKQGDFAADVIRRCKEYGEQYAVEDEDKDVVIFEESSDESEIWDCETIVSTYSNLDNHPRKIEIPGATRKKKLVDTVTAALSASSPIISLRGKAKLPVDFLPGDKKPAAEKVKDTTTAKAEQYKRKQHGLESKEEKKERKAAVKEERREARRTKKEMKELYKCEAHRAQRVAAVSGPSSIHLL